LAGISNTPGWGAGRAGTETQIIVDQKLSADADVALKVTGNSGMVCHLDKNSGLPAAGLAVMCCAFLQRILQK
jgi:hypothetical protein